jgi:hypothetical protein
MRRYVTGASQRLGCDASRSIGTRSGAWNDPSRYRLSRGPPEVGSGAGGGGGLMQPQLFASAQHLNPHSHTLFPSVLMQSARVGPPDRGVKLPAVAAGSLPAVRAKAVAKARICSALMVGLHLSPNDRQIRCRLGIGCFFVTFVIADDHSSAWCAPGSNGTRCRGCARYGLATIIDACLLVASTSLRTRRCAGMRAQTSVLRRAGWTRKFSPGFSSTFRLWPMSRVQPHRATPRPAGRVCNQPTATTEDP